MGLTLGDHMSLATQQLKERLREAERVIKLYQRWEQASDRECETDVDLDTGTMLIEASFAANSYFEKHNKE